MAKTVLRGPRRGVSRSATRGAPVRLFTRSRSPRSRPSRASSPRPTGWRCRASAALRFTGSCCSAPAVTRPLRRSRGGWRRTRSVHGSISRGSFPLTPGSPSAPARSSISTSAAGRASCCIRATTDLGRREDPDPGTRPRSRHRPAGARADDGRRARVRTPWRAVLPGRLGRAPRAPVRALRSNDGDRAVRSARRPGHEPSPRTWTRGACSGSSTTVPAIAATRRSSACRTRGRI